MKICIDITSAIYHRGVSRYTTNLAKSLTYEPGVEVSVFGYSFRQKENLVKIAKPILPDSYQKNIKIEKLIESIGFVDTKTMVVIKQQKYKKYNYEL